MARTLFRNILIILLCFTFYKIFQFSSENAEVSGSRSTEIMRKIINNFPYTKNLSELAQKAEELELIEDEDLLNQTIEFCEKEINEMPKTPKEAKIYLYEEYYKESEREQTEKLILDGENLIAEIVNFYKNVYYNEINLLEYKSIRQNFFITGNEIISKLNQTRKNVISLEMDDLATKISEMISRVQLQIEKMPIDYKIAKELGHREAIKTTLKEKEVELENIKNSIDKLQCQMLHTSRAWEYTQDFIDIDDQKISLNNETKELKTSVESFVNIPKKEQKELKKEVKQNWDEAKKTNKFLNTMYTTMKEDYEERKEIQGAYSLFDKVYETMYQKKEVIEQLHKIKEFTTRLYYYENVDLDDNYKKILNEFKKKDQIIEEEIDTLREYFNTINLSDILANVEDRITSYNGFCLLWVFGMIAAFVFLQMTKKRHMEEPANRYVIGMWWQRIHIALYGTMCFVTRKKLKQEQKKRNDIKEAILILEKHEKDT